MTPTPSTEPVASRTAEGASSPPGRIERHLVILMPLAAGLGLVTDGLAPGWAEATPGIAIDLLLVFLAWTAIIPTMLQADPVRQIRYGLDWRGASIALFIGGIARPVTAALLASLLLAWMAGPLLPSHDLPAYVVGLTILAAGPPSVVICLWAGLAAADLRFTILQMLLSTAASVMIAAPITVLVLDVPLGAVLPPGAVLALIFYFVAPVGIATFARRRLQAARGAYATQLLISRLRPVSLCALLLMLALISAIAAPVLVRHPVVVALVALPLVCQAYLNAAQAMLIGRLLRLGYDRAAPAALIGATGAALVGAAATSAGPAGSVVAAVGILAEIPIGLSIILALDACRGWYEGGTR